MNQDSPRNEHRPRLGRGLAALLGDTPADAPDVDRNAGLRTSPIEFLRPNPRNPRRSFDGEDLEELAASIRERGIIQPILVRRIPKVANAFEIIAGERRWRAAQRANLHEVPILVLDVGDREALEIAIVENVQRTDLTALEEARGYQQLGEDHGYAHSDIARVVGKSRSHIANTLRLLNLPEHSKELLASGAISAGHARALLAVHDPDAVAAQIVSRGLTVRDVERLGENAGKTQRTVKRRAASEDADTRALEDKLGLTLGATVFIRHASDKGEIRILFRGLDQLDDLCRRLLSPTTLA